MSNKSLKKCRVRECTSESPGRFFLFPRKQEELQKWVENLRIPPTQDIPTYNAFVCIKHFERSAVGAKKLKAGAVPTLNLGYEEAPPHLWTGPLPRRRCCIRSCASRGATIFEFPKKEDVRQSWAKACNLVVSPSDTLFICRNHFDSQFVAKYKLLPGAFPCLRLEPALSRSSSSADSNWVCPPVTVTYERPKVAVGVEEDDITLKEFEQYSILEESRLGLGPQNNDVGSALDSRERFARSARYYQSNALRLNKKIEELEGVIKDLEKKYEDLEQRAIVADVSSSSDAITFARMIVTKHNVFSDNERTLAQNINYMSTKSYSFMRDDLGFALPSKSSLLRWRPIRYVVPGIHANVLGNLQKISKKMSALERNCVLLFDEISIKSDLTYNRVRDVIDGFVDHGEGQREMIIGSKCCFL
ncbi:uncharacterized protein LOC109580001 isoform X2 [Bactrocera dorsalis]|uniref:Uncharacterized protein LOC109580001 isoform X2 n=1 Tax=Bactrocera dorsalis TaxID=27457 RepID=A0ABM3J9U0_BACDO|nr:uncharacterized protein LOC109580001 isoform X2 [Bactrocera dorsalis]